MATPGTRISRILDNLWKQLKSVFRADSVTGSQRPVSRGFNQVSSFTWDFDLEIPEYPVRDVPFSSGSICNLIEMVNYCPEVAAATDYFKSDILSSQDGDDIGCSIDPQMENGETLDPKVKEILDVALNRLFPVTNLEMIIDRIINYGDCFAERIFDNPKKPTAVQDIMILPTWEMFRVEKQGILLGFEQRRYISDSEAIFFNPVKITHWRRRRINLYGRSQYLESVGDWGKLREATANLANACNSVGVNPNVHKLPPGCTDKQRDEYKAKIEDKEKDGIITNFFLLDGGDISKLSTSSPDLKALVDTVLMWRSRIVMKTQVPPYLLMPVTATSGTRELSGQPALVMSRVVNTTRACLTSGIKETLNLELVLNGISPKDYPYKVVWPQLVVNIYQGQEVEVGEGSPETDTEPSENSKKLERVYSEF